MEVRESKAAEKDLNKAPIEVIFSYETWARLIEEHGLKILRSFKGYHDEKLRGNLEGYRSSRLNKRWRVIYRIEDDGVLKIAEVSRIALHNYRRKK